MSAHIDAVRNKITEIVDKCQQQHPGIALRVAFVGYRDFGLAVLPLTDAFPNFQAMVFQQSTFGGGHGAEDVIGGLHAVRSLRWAAKTCVLYHVGAMPCHGRAFHDLSCDHYPHGDPHGLLVQEILYDLRGKGVHYLFGRIGEATDKMVEQFNFGVNPRQLVIQTPIDIDRNAMMELVVITQTFTQCNAAVSQSGREEDGKIRQKRVLLDKQAPSWSGISVEITMRFSMTVPESIACLSLEDEDRCVNDFPDTMPSCIKMAVKPFAKGGLRAAHYGQLINPDETLRGIILKDSLAQHRKFRTKHDYEKFLVCHRAAKFLAVEFNVIKPQGCPSVRYVDAHILQLMTRWPEQPFVICEEQIPGGFEKFNSNTGYCAPNPTRGSGVNHDAVQAFSHWTHCVTIKRMMVVDCQGRFDMSSNSFLLTDPAVHSVNLLQYGRTNLAEKGFNNFFSTHKCNSICIALHLPFCGPSFSSLFSTSPNLSTPPVPPVLPTTAPVLSTTSSASSLKADDVHLMVKKGVDIGLQRIQVERVQAHATECRKEVIHSKQLSINPSYLTVGFSEQERRSQHSASLDIAILLSCAPSMVPHMRAIKEKVSELMNGMLGRYPNILLRLAFVSYGHGGDSGRHDVLPFTTSFTEFEDMVSKQRATGQGCSAGGDSTHGTLNSIVSDLAWKSKSRALYHVDPRRNYGFFQGDNMTADVLLEGLRANDVQYFWGTIGNTTNTSVVQHFNALHSFPPPDLKCVPLDATAMMSAMANTIFRSIVTATLKTTDGQIPQKVVEVDQGQPDWSTVPSENAMCFAMTVPESVVCLLAEVDGRCVNDFPEPMPVNIKIAPKAFTKGSLRAAHFGQEAIDGDLHGMIFKNILAADKQLRTKHEHEHFLVCHRAAKFLAEEFNKVKPFSCSCVSYVDARILQLMTRWPEQPFVICEQQIPGVFEKYNSNTGYCAPCPTGSGVDHDAVQAFSHWTYCATEGKLMVVDCQGGFDSETNTFLLTDPAVHAINYQSALQFGDSPNLGSNGFDAFFATHVCNQYCQLLNLQVPEPTAPQV